MEFEDFRKALDANALFHLTDDGFDKYARQLYEAAGGRKLKPENTDSYFAGFRIGTAYGVYFMADLLAACAKACTIVAWNPKRGKKL